jgi:hypothetical protein
MFASIPMMDADQRAEVENKALSDSQVLPCAHIENGLDEPEFNGTFDYVTSGLAMFLHPLERRCPKSGTFTVSIADWAAGGYTLRYRDSRWEASSVNIQISKSLPPTWANHPFLPVELRGLS